MSSKQVITVLTIVGLVLHIVSEGETTARLIKSLRRS